MNALKKIPVWSISAIMAAIFISTLCSSFVWGASTDGSAKETIVVIEVEGNGVAKVRRKSGIQTAIGKNMAINQGDIISTDANTSVEVLLLDGSIVRIGTNTDYKFEKLNENKGLLSWIFTLTKGRIRGLIEKSPDKNHVKFRVNTPTGTMGVRGTEFVLEYNPVSRLTKLFMLHGRVFFGNPSCEKNKKCKIIEAGNSSSVGSQNTEATDPQKYSTLEMLGGQPGATDGEQGANQSSNNQTINKDALSLFKDPNTISLNGLNASNSGELESIVSGAIDSLQTTQDSFLQRTAEQRKEMHKAIDDGSFSQYMNIAEGYSSQQSTSDVGLGGNSDYYSSSSSNGFNNANRFALADEIVKSSALDKALSGSGDGGSALDTNALIKEKVASAEKLFFNSATDTAKSSSTPSSASTSVSSTATTTATAATKEIDKGTEVEIKSDPKVEAAAQKVQETKKCGFFEFGCHLKKMFLPSTFTINTTSTNTKTNTSTFTKTTSSISTATKTGTAPKCDVSGGKVCK
ncbi:MAG: FecR family protein [Oligoflexia bacterium]|nr:FecR family protein [Oligoflexia bacterium]